MKILFIIFFLVISVLTEAQSKWKIAYVHWVDTVTSENRLNTMDIDGSNIQSVIDYPGSSWMPLVFDNKIWFHIEKDTAGKRKGLYIYDQEKEHYLFDAKCLYQDISLDTNSNMYAGGFLHKAEGRLKSQYDIFLFNENGSFKKAITSDTAIDLEPWFSPDGKQLVFRSNRDRNPKSWAEFEIYIVNSDGSGLKRLSYNPDTTKNVLRSANPCFTPDGRIAYTAFLHGTYRIMIMNTDGTGLMPLFKMDELEQTGFNFSADGKLVVFTGRKKGAGNADIYLINSDGTGLRQLTNDWKRKVQPFFIKVK